MAKLNLNYYNNDGGYSDGGVETQILHMLQSGQSPEEIIEKDERWPVFYHLTPRRENILNWYPFKKNSTILEVGSGCGALTGLLCREGDTVVSVELTLPRAQVNFERNKKYDNLEIIVGNFNNMIFEDKFDYIVLNGVLEYAASFTDSDHPYLTFIERMKALLKEDGVLLIAIENRLGLKYFNGTPEDHTARLFDGLNNYGNVDGVRTFSKTELEKLLESAGFHDLDFYFPVPDYKLPEVIYTEETLPIMDTQIDERVYNTNRLKFFDESKVMQVLNQEGIADRFQNSFLVAASMTEKNEPEHVIFAKTPHNRKKEYLALTKISEDDQKNRSVSKKALYPEGEAHLKKMYEYYQNFPGNGSYQNVPASFDEDTITFDYLDGKTLEEELMEILSKRDKEEFESRIKDYAANLLDGSEIGSDYYNEDFAEVFGEESLDVPLHLKDNANIDLIFSNIIETDRPYIIDYEWTTDFKIPVEFLIWRGLYYFYLKNNISDLGISLNDLLALADIDPDLHSTFIKWDEHFGNVYAGDQTDDRYFAQTVDAGAIFDGLLKTQNQESTLYLDFGLGNFEDSSIREKYKFDPQSNAFKITFDLKPFLEKEEGRLYNLRWDPVEAPCSLENIKITTNVGELELDTVALDPQLGTEDKGAVHFFTNDPNINIVGDYDDVDTVTITGTLNPFSLANTLDMAASVSEKEAQVEAERAVLEQQLYESKDRVRELERRLARLERES